MAGSRRLVDWLVNHARTMIYSTGLPPAAAAAAARSLEIIEAEPWRRIELMARSAAFREALPGVGPGGPIVPIVIGEPVEGGRGRRPPARPGLPRPGDPAADGPGRDGPGFGSA